MSSGVYRFFAVAYQRDGPPNSPRLDQAWTKTRCQKSAGYRRTRIRPCRGKHDTVVTLFGEGRAKRVVTTDRIIEEFWRDDGASEVTAALWVKTTKTGQQGVVSAARAGNDNEFLLFLLSSTKIRLYTEGTFYQWTVPSVADDGWHHLAVTRDVSASRVELFLDGVSQGTRTAVLSPLSIDPGGLVLAQGQDSVGGGFNRCPRRSRGASTRSVSTPGCSPQPKSPTWRTSNLSCSRPCR